jgi:hypothetical protein
MKMMDEGNGMMGWWGWRRQRWVTEEEMVEKIGDADGCNMVVLVVLAVLLKEMNGDKVRRWNEYEGYEKEAKRIWKGDKKGMAELAKGEWRKDGWRNGGMAERRKGGMAKMAGMAEKAEKVERRKKLEWSGKRRKGNMKGKEKGERKEKERRGRVG